MNLFKWLHKKPKEFNCMNCHACIDEMFPDLMLKISAGQQRMIVCPECGNKRCPKANNHRYHCTRSNEPGQKGSAYA